MATITFDSAKSFGIRFGKHKSRTLNQVAGDGDEGLQYLSWLSGRDELHDDLRAALDVFLGHPDVASDVANATRNRS